MSSRTGLIPRAVQLQSLRPSPQSNGWRWSLQNFPQSKKKDFSLITGFITRETAGLGRKKIAWLLRPVPFQEEDTGWTSCQLVWPTWYFHLSYFRLWAAGPACLQPGQQDQSEHEWNLYSGVVQSYWSHCNLSIFTHCTRRHIWGCRQLGEWRCQTDCERLGLGGQTADSTF